MAGTPDEILTKEEVTQYSFDMGEEAVEETMKVCESYVRERAETVHLCAKTCHFDPPSWIPATDPKIRQYWVFSLDSSFQNPIDPSTSFSQITR